MKMKIVLLVLHIICTVLFGICAVINTNMVAASLYMIASIVWGVNVGIDIVLLIFKL